MASRTAAKAVLPVLKTVDPGFEAAFAKLERRREQGAEDVERDVRRIVEEVRQGGDEGLLACVRRYDGAKTDVLEVSREETRHLREEVEFYMTKLELIDLACAQSAPEGLAQSVQRLLYADETEIAAEAIRS